MNPHSPLFNDCCDARRLRQQMAKEFGAKYTATEWTIYSTIRHGDPDVQERIVDFVLQARWNDVKKHVRLRSDLNAAQRQQIRLAFEAMLLAGEVKAAYAFLGVDCAALETDAIVV